MFPTPCHSPPSAFIDVYVFGPAKNQWRKKMIETRASYVTKEDFLRMLVELYDKAFLPKHFKSDFRKCDLQ